MMSHRRSPFRHILILADIEGSSGCWSYEASKFLTPEWARACLDMSLDVAAVVRSLFEAGVERVTVQDYHRTGFNLLPELIDKKARVVQGYRPGPIPGLGTSFDAEAVIMLGMHAASGRDGFLPHTLTSRFRSLEANGRRLPEVVLFAASLAPYGVKPIFFSGCMEACWQAVRAIRGLSAFALDKGNPQAFSPGEWRQELAEMATDALMARPPAPFNPPGPFRVQVTIRGTESDAAGLASRWGLNSSGNIISFTSTHLSQLYQTLTRLAYLTPLTKTALPLSLRLYRIVGRTGLHWVRRHLNRRFPGWLNQA